MIPTPAGITPGAITYNIPLTPVLTARFPTIFFYTPPAVYLRFGVYNLVSRIYTIIVIVEPDRA